MKIHEKASNRIHITLRNAGRLPYTNEKYDICLVTEASDTIWAATVKQTNEEHVKKISVIRNMSKWPSWEAKALERKEAGQRWKILAFAVFGTLNRMEYLLLFELLVFLFTNNRNLLYMLAPLAVRPDSWH